uniref:RNase NYN domain-containing protein n=1 Tax=Haptolina brevifila TaxID=156173 RepID=A0A7S2NQA8_9EUKA|mmetsp:Transcript_86241/g.172194  ORF Transcript_86241/g.172194 Transcript_86241/m.172194 type:complete len:176 (+) Transcript_86241:796-1323(+)
MWALDGGRRSLVGGEGLLPYVQHELLHLSPTGTNDDDFILKLARCRDAYVLTNDLFRDHIAQGRVPKQWVAARRVSYMYVHKQILTVMPSPPMEPSRPAVQDVHVQDADIQDANIQDASAGKKRPDKKRPRPHMAICKRPRHGNRPGGGIPAMIPAPSKVPLQPMLQLIVPSSVN